MEVLINRLMERNELLKKFLNLPSSELVRNMDTVHKLVVLSELFDESWVAGLQLSFLEEERSTVLHATGKQVSELRKEISDLTETESQLLMNRRKYAEEIGVERQSVLRHRARFEELSHHLNVFSTGVHLVSLRAGQSFGGLVSVGEQMRCSYNELRRVNASLEEKLVMTGVSKQKVISNLDDLLLSLRASCTRNPHKYRPLNEDPNSIKGGNLPVVPSLSGEQAHNDLLTCLSVSFGHFAEECINSIADVSLSSKDKKGIRDDSSHLEEQALLVGVLSVETNRYRSIVRSLRAAIDDAQQLLVFSSAPSVRDVIQSACERIKNRLAGCANVTYWKILDSDPNKAVGITSASGSSIDPLKKDLEIDILELGNVGNRGALFLQVGLNNTLRFDIGDKNTTCLVPQDVGAVILHDQITGTIEAFAVSSSSASNGGLTVVRIDGKDAPFPPYSGIYADQIYRRIVSAIAPLQEVQEHRATAKRPLDLVECMFELRKKGNSPLLFMQQVSNHFKILFNADYVCVFIPLELDNKKIVFLPSCSCLASYHSGVLGEDLDGASIVDTSKIPQMYRDFLSDSVYLIRTPGTISDVIKSNLSLGLGPQDFPSDLSGLVPSGPTSTTHIRSVLKNGGARSGAASFVVCWTTCVSDSNSSSHNRSILDHYAHVMQGMLGTWFGSGIFQIEENLVSFEVETEIEAQQILKVISTYS